MKTVAEIIRELESKAPSSTAESWDNVGLLCGDPSTETSGAVVSVDLTEEAIEQARARGFKLIVNHHPCIFPKQKGLSSIVAGEYSGSRLVFEALKHGISVIAAHTNFDRCALDVVDAIAKGIGARPTGRLLEKASGSCVKLVVFVPTAHVDAVRQAICEAGAGQIGAYDFCSFAAEGRGTFRGGAGTQPFIGKTGQLETVDELRLETILPRGLEKAVLAALFRSHPYEEPAYDLIPVEQAPSGKGLARGLGYGFVGELEKPRPLRELAAEIETLFETKGFLITGEPSPDRLIRRVAWSPGKGSSFVGAVIAAKCDLFFTGETGYHDALHASKRGVAVMELGHRESERFYLKVMTAWMQAAGLQTVELNTKTQRISG